MGSTEGRGTTLSLTGLTVSGLRDRLGAFLNETGEPSYRFDQIVDWVYRRCALNFESMSNLPKQLRRGLERNFSLHCLSFESKVESDDRSMKFLFSTEDGFPVESVILPVSDGATYCLSTASGCPVSCAFCASGTFFNRFLSSGEIIDQFLLMKSLSGNEPPFSGVVLMGMGEPLVNWRETYEFLNTVRSVSGVGSRRITVSTVGVPSKIEALGRESRQVKLAVSLHGATDEVRNKLVPYAKNAPLHSLTAACRRYVELTGGRRITFEYVLLSGVNDGTRDAQCLCDILKGLPASVNLIPFNPFPGARFERPAPAVVQKFAGCLRKCFRGDVTVRRSLGSSAWAACGQLGAGRSG